MKACGIDIGSRFVKIAVSDGEGISFFRKDSLDFYRNITAARNEFSECRTVCTGYGRHLLKIPGSTVLPEIQAHALGACVLLDIGDFTVLDIGGQDTKVSLVRNKKVISFQTNDKCAASSGRFLENMAAVLKIELFELLMQYEEPVEISATCAVFAESEVIGALVQGISVEKIAAGVMKSLFCRISPWISENSSDVLVLTGGIAQSSGLKHLITERFPEIRVMIPENPEFTGAYGCLVKALENS